jgi:hypothetical protein
MIAQLGAQSNDSDRAASVIEAPTVVADGLSPDFWRRLQPIDGLVTEEVPVEDLFDIALLNADVHDAVRVHENGGPELARAETSGAGDCDPAKGLAFLDQAFELHQQALGAAFATGALGVTEGPGVETDEDVFLGSGHDGPFGEAVRVMNSSIVQDVPLTR